jgi:hypothetical protein
MFSAPQKRKAVRSCQFREGSEFCWRSRIETLCDASECEGWRRRVFHAQVTRRSGNLIQNRVCQFVRFGCSSLRYLASGSESNRVTYE